MSTSGYFMNQITNNGIINARTKSVSFNQNPSHTLPITCQICLGKVKDPCICSNLHTFCSGCIDIWLEKGKHCPTCRVPISEENPCRRILGGVENLDDADMLKPLEFSNSSIRKARYMNIFQQYEDEVARLLKYIDSLNIEVSKLKNSSKSNHSSETSLIDPMQNELLHSLRTKLQQSQISLNQTSIERDKLKETNRKLDSENSILLQETSRLKLIISEKTSQMSSKYAVAALETKVESYEKEVKQLQKALEKSDKYIAELERSDFMKNNRNCPQKENYLNELNSEELIAKHRSIDTKSVTFANKSQTSYSNLLISPNELKASSTNASQNFTAPLANKQVTITKDNFYGSPSKKSPCKSSTGPLTSIKSISSFSDRLQNTSGSSLTRNMFSTNNDEPQSSKLYSKQTQQGSVLNSSSNAQNSTQSFLFSPMKRLRIDECTLEKPDDSLTKNLSEASDMNITTPPKQIINFNRAPIEPDCRMPSVKFLDMDSKQIANSQSSIISDNPLGAYKSDGPTNSSSSSEFSDCLMLLNQAEQKVNSRISPSFKGNSSSELPLADKYFQSSSDLNTVDNSQSYVNFTSNNNQQMPLENRGQQVTMSLSDFSSQESFEITNKQRQSNEDPMPRQGNFVFYNK